MQRFEGYFGLKFENRILRSRYHRYFGKYIINFRGISNACIAIDRYLSCYNFLKKNRTLFGIQVICLVLF